MLTGILPSGASPLPDTPLHCTRCGGPAPRLAATILLLRSPRGEVLNVEVQIFYCVACDLPIGAVCLHATPLAPPAEAPIEAST